MKRIDPIDHPVNATVTLPGSKSYTNRALIIAALAAGTSQLRQALFSDDTVYMAQALRELGIPVTADETTNTFTVEGRGGSIPASRPISSSAFPVQAPAFSRHSPLWAAVNTASMGSRACGSVRCSRYWSAFSNSVGVSGL